MIGLVNAAGSPESSRVQAVQAAALQHDEEERKKSAFLVTSIQAAARVLESAVESIEFTAGPELRSVPGGEQSDRFDQADEEAQPAETLGSRLDLTA